MSESRWLILESHFSLLIPWVKLRLLSHLSQPLVKMTTHRTHHVEPTPISCRYCIDTLKRNYQFPRHFDIFFWCNFDERKIDVVSTYFVWRNFNDQNIDVLSMHFFRPDFDEKKSTFFWCIFRYNLDEKLM